MKEINCERLNKICGQKLNVFQQNAIYEWGKEYGESIQAELKRQYEQKFQEDLGRSIDYFLISIAFVLHFGETTKYGKKRVYEVLKDIQATVDMFTTHEYSPQDYQKMLAEDGIHIKLKVK